MHLKAQSNMRRNYMNGGPGVAISGLVWLLAVLVTTRAGFQTGLMTFFLGGMLIHPLSVIISRQFTPQAPPPDKGLVRLALLSLPVLFAGLFLSYMLSKHNPALFYPAMAVTIGLRYLIFYRVYGLKKFIILGGLLMFIGALFFGMQAKLVVPPIIVGACELFFGILLMRQERA